MRSRGLGAHPQPDPVESLERRIHARVGGGKGERGPAVSNLGHARDDEVRTVDGRP